MHLKLLVSNLSCSATRTMYCNKRTILSMSAGGACRGCHPRYISQALPQCLPQHKPSACPMHGHPSCESTMKNIQTLPIIQQPSPHSPAHGVLSCFAHAARRASHALLGSLAPGASMLAVSTVWRRVCTTHEHFTLQRNLQRFISSLLAIACSGSQALAQALKHSRCMTVGS